MSEIPTEDRVKLRSAPRAMPFSFQETWLVMQPQVYRYEDQEWIDEFFDTGKLRLSSFAKFATYEDEVRGDTQEGKAYCYGETTDGKSVGVAQQQGINAAILCASHRLSHELAHAFGRNSAFQITDTPMFAYEIRRQIIGFKSGIEGNCTYRSEGIIKRFLNFSLNPEQHKNEDGTLNKDLLLGLGQALGGPELVFLKRKHYEEQQEYRLIWELDQAVDDHIDVVAPLARQYCRRVEPKEWELYT